MTQSFADKVDVDNKNISKYDGYFTFYYDEGNDKIFLEIENLDKEFLYVNALSEGIGSNDIGLDRGQLGNTRIVKFIKNGNKLLLIQPNQYYRAITNNIEEKKSVEQAFAKSILKGFVIKETSSLSQRRQFVDASAQMDYRPLKLRVRSFNKYLVLFVNFYSFDHACLRGRPQTPSLLL